VKDAAGAQSPNNQFYVSIVPSIAPPVATGVTYVVQASPGQSTTITLPSSGAPGDQLDAVITSFPTNGQLYNADGSLLSTVSPVVTSPTNTITFVPNDGSSGPGTFSYAVKSTQSGQVSAPSTVRYNVVPVVVNSPPVVTVSPIDFIQENGQTVGFFSVQAKDTNGDPTTLVFTKFPSLKSGTLSYQGSTISIGDACKNCSYVLLSPYASDVSADGKTTTWNLLYRASSDTNDSVSFEVADRQITNSSQLAAFPVYTVALDPSKASTASQHTPVEGSGGDKYASGHGKAGSNSGNGNSSSGGGRSTWDKLWWWFLLLIIGCCLCCCIMLLLLLIAGALARGRKNRGYQRVRRTKRGGDQPYENLGAYSPPSL